MRKLKMLLTPLKELGNLLFAAAAVLGIVGIFVDEDVRSLVPLVAVVGVVMFAAHLVRQNCRRKAAVHVQPSDRRATGA